MRACHDSCLALFEKASDSFFEIDEKGTFTFANASFLHLIGKKHFEVVGHNINDIIVDPSGMVQVEALQHAKKTTEMIPSSWLIASEEDGSFKVNVKMQPVLGCTGELCGFWGLAEHVEESESERVLASDVRDFNDSDYSTSIEAERRYHGFLNFLPLPLVVRKFDHSVVYINAAFERTFGWTLSDLQKDPLIYIPPEQLQTTKSGKRRLLQHGSVLGLETTRRTREGRLLEVICDRSVLYDDYNQPAGMVIIFRDITQYKKDARISASFFSIANALHHYSDLDSRLYFVAKQVQKLMKAQRAHITLVDEDNRAFYFRIGVGVEPETYKKIYRERFPLSNKFFSGSVILSGSPKVINDLAQEKVELIVGDKNIKNMLGVPVKVGPDTIGAITVCNKEEGYFSKKDINLLKNISNIVSLPIENAKINDRLKISLSEIRSLNKAKDRIIEHLSHELRTPLSILTASLKILANNELVSQEKNARIIERCQRNLHRITGLQDKIVDIMHNPHQDIKESLLGLLELCTDELESQADNALSAKESKVIRHRINKMFAPQSDEIQRILLRPFVLAKCKVLRAECSHRRVLLLHEINDTAGFVDFPVDVLDKVLTGLIRNAIEYTPDGGKVEVKIGDYGDGLEMSIIDTGIGITEENKQLIFSNYFTNADITRYGTGKPFDFNAGGSGFDLLRIRVFSERYNFKLIMESQRCPHIPDIHDICPGDSEKCIYCDGPHHCYLSGGTRFTVRFCN